MRSPRGHVGLTTEILVDTALRILNAEGAKSLTTRRLALEHDVKHPALYHHFASKEILLGHVSARLLRMGLAEAPVTDDWRAWLEGFSLSMRNVLLRYRDGAAIVAGSAPVHQTQDSIVPAICAPMLAAGLSRAEANALYCCVSSFTLGWVVNEQNEAKYAMMAAMTRLDETFARGLKAMIGGLSPDVDAAAGQASARDCRASTSIARKRA